MTDTLRIDLNADLGESFGRWQLGDDEGMLALVSSANVACGFHAGDPLTLVSTCRSAVRRGVAIGAQVGYRDLAGFGRRFVDVAPDDLYADVLYQLSALDGIARTSGGAVGYVKPHGALYHAVSRHEAQAQAVVAATADYAGGLCVLGAAGSALLTAAAAAGLPTVSEAYADRAYRGDGSLVPRTEAGALVTDAEEVAGRVLRMVTEGRVTDTDGTDIAVDVRSVCLHGDSPGAVGMARAVRAALTGAGVEIAPFAPPTVQSGPQRARSTRPSSHTGSPDS